MTSIKGHGRKHLLLPSLQSGSAAQVPHAKSVAAGLAPPFAGFNAFNHVKQQVDGVRNVTDVEIKAAVRLALDKKLVVEPSGVAGLAALLSGKVTKSCLVKKRLFNWMFFRFF